jgi:DNA invertase Pin-like site-specific DNA recombinase
VKENYRLGSDIQSKMIAVVLSLVSELERQLISQRTTETLKRLKNEGKHLGRPYGFSYQKLRKKHQKIVELLEKGMTKAEIARLFGCSWLTIHRYVKKFISIPTTC